MRIGVDLDGVVIDHGAHFLEAAHRRGYRLTLRQANSNIFRTVVPEPDRAAIKEQVYRHTRSTAGIYPQALAFLKRYKDSITIMSIQNDASIERDTRLWLKRHGITQWIPRTRVMLVRTRDTKLRCIARLSPDVFIDDGLDVLERLPKRTLPIMFDPVGAHRMTAVPSHIRIASGWNVIPGLLDSTSRRP